MKYYKLGDNSMNNNYIILNITKCNILQRCIWNLVDIHERAFSKKIVVDFQALTIFTKSFIFDG